MFHFDTELSDFSVVADLQVNASAMLLLPAVLKTGRMFQKLNERKNKQTHIRNTPLSVTLVYFFLGNKSYETWLI